ncbi:type IV secretory system conjugative DNA transfer family protein [Streptomyces sp. NBC_01353]|uniref:type IV secretory system conjugative DNA transfer family protein n=1 Tax=Streptomyces sp. NBC_01353 TaxID=2903835 RepID=UPI002E2EC83D|nr:type IV secretory system conjugative DNA transfer family protein [Streptomyces sp. NBC_01353]
MSKDRQDRQQGGIPDGLVVGLVGFVLGLTVLVWTATGLAALLSKGAWPATVTFTRTPMAVRALIGNPQDLPGAWPDTPAGELSGYGLFWGLLIGELMVLVVLTVFAVGTLARWRAVRAGRRAANGTAPTFAAQVQAPVAQPVAQPVVQPVPQPVATAAETLIQPTLPPTTPSTAPTPQPVAPAPTPQTVVPSPRTPRLLYGTPATRRPAALQAVQDAEGPVLVVTSDPTVWSDTKDARGKLGPVLVYDPGHLCDTPARLHWSPSAGCVDPATAQERAVALLAPVRPPSRLDAAVADTAETLLRCWLHAAALDDRPFKQVHRWAQGTGAHEPVRILRTHAKAAAGHAGLLESALTAHPERREIAQELTARALSALSSIHIRDACTPNRTDSLALESFVAEGGTLYVVGETIEDPRTRPGAMPLLTALTASVVEHGRRMAARSSDGRLDPPMTLVLDDVAAVAPLPRLPELLASGQDQGLPTLVLLRSQEQARARWPEPLPQG